jgi:hypothetical protein
MMEDEKVAKAFLSAIIGEEVVELDFSAQELTRRPAQGEQQKKKSRKAAKQDETFLTVCRFDFSAKISVPDGGFKTVMIELQKAKLLSDVMRFRRYLGLHYQNPNNTYDGGDDSKKARQIYCIFLLGHDIGIPDRPVLQVDYNAKDSTTKTAVASTNEFIQSLHHRSWIVQIDQLKQRRRSAVEKLLSIFDQANRTKNHHILNVDEDDFPEVYRHIIRRLRMASESEEIQREMELEDDLMKELQDKERLIAHKDKIIEEKDKALGEKDKIIEEKNKALDEKDKALDEKDKVIDEKDKIIDEDKKALSERDMLIGELKKQLKSKL